MNEKLKNIFVQSLMISTGILAVICVEGIVYHLLGDEPVFSWYLPLSVLLTGFSCAVPTVLLLGHEGLSPGAFLIRLMIHMILLYGIVVAMGYVFSWYSKLDGFLFVTGGYFFVYIFVWASNIWLNKQNAKKINEALKSIQDED